MKLLLLGYIIEEWNKAESVSGNRIPMSAKIQIKYNYRLTLVYNSNCRTQFGSQVGETSLLLVTQVYVILPLIDHTQVKAPDSKKTNGAINPETQLQ